MTCLRIAAALIVSILIATPAAAVDLPRRAFFGIAMASDRQTGNGATITEVLPGGTGASLGLRAGDLIVQAGNEAVTRPDQVVAYAGSLQSGAQAALTIRRGQRTLRVRGPAIGRPRETFAGGRTDYGAVDHGGGQLRDILVMPEGAASPPVVYLIQGFSCASIENPDYRRLGEELIREGIGYYRVEKPGMGDSTGGAHCTTIDYAAELDAFRTAYRHLTDARGIEADRVFMFGHSLGGLQAPMLAAERPPRGVAVFGTVFRNWHDYHRDITQFQGFLFSGADLGESTAQGEAVRDVYRRFYMLRESPSAIVAANSGANDALRTFFGWDGGERAFGRSYRFMQDLAHIPLVAAWRDARTNVLALYGESDFVALFDLDHRLIADLANVMRPGTGRFVQIARTGHGMDVIGSPAEVRAHTRASGAPPNGEFNPEVARQLAGWIRESMARPPVREQFPAPATPAASG